MAECEKRPFSRTVSEVASLARRCSESAGHGVYLGTGTQGWTWSRPQHSVLVVGPPRSGKTSSCLIPAICATNGAVVSTSTKAEVMRATARVRREVGHCYLFDPSGTVALPDGVTRLWWSPVHTASDWDRALSTAHSLVATARPSEGSGEARHWTERAESLIAPLLHAAATMGLPMRAVVRWVNRREYEDALNHLQSEKRELACDLLYGIVATEERELSGIWSTASEILAPYRGQGALDSAGPEAPLGEKRPSANPSRSARASDPPGIFMDPESFVRSCDTLYICAPARRQDLVAPLIVSLLDDVRAAAYDLSAQASPRAPLLLALDEIANIAPIPDLPSLVSEGGGQGVITLACIQDLSQARSRWGSAADGFLTLFGTKVVLPGIADIGTLETLSKLTGNAETATKAVTTPMWWSALRQGSSVTWSLAERTLLPPDEIARGCAGSAYVYDGANRPERIVLTPYFATDPWQAICETAIPEVTRSTDAPEACRKVRSLSRPDRSDPDR